MTTYNDYAAAAVIAKEAEIQMLERLDVVALRPNHIVTMGFGTDSSETLLRERYPQATITRLDFTEHMLEGGWTRLSVSDLPLTEDSVDLIISNLFLPWCAEQEKLFLEWRRILRPEGLLMFTSLGPDTLVEWQDQATLLPHRYDMHDVGDALVRAGFADPVLDVEQFGLRYRDFSKLLHELTITGMIESNTAPPATQGAMHEMTYEIVYAHTWGATVVTTEGIVKVPLSQIGGRTKG